MENIQLEKTLAALRQELSETIDLAIEMLETATEAFFKHNKDLAQKVISELEPIMDERDLTTERHCIEVIALYHPQARELRFVTMTMKMNTELERIGDLAVGIAGTTVMLGASNMNYNESDFKKLSMTTISLLKLAKDSIETNDAEKAEKVIRLDKEINEQRNLVIENLLNMIKNSSTKVEMCYELMRIAHKLERIGDQCKNLAEEVIYTIRGHLRH